MSRGSHTPNLAARMGRWSAAHWKAATFGWLAFVVVAFAVGGLVGTKDANPNTTGPGQSGRMDRILNAGFKQPAGESVLIQSTSLRVSDPAFRAAVEDVVTRVSKATDVQNVRSPFASPNTSQVAKNGHAALVEFDIRGDKQKAVDKIAPVLDQRRRCAACSSRPLHRRVRGCKRGQGGRNRLRERPVQGGRPIASDHARHPGGHVRCAGGGGHSAAARADCGVRNLRAACGAEPPAADGAAGLRDGAPDRACRRRRLLDVLPEARAPGARGGAQLGGRTRGGRRHIRALGARLRAHGDGRDGRHVPDRRCDIRVARPGDDPRGGRRRGRFADRPAGRALEAGRQRRPAARPVHQPAQRRQRGRADLGRDRRPCPAQARAVGARRRRDDGGARRAGGPAPHRNAGAGHVPEVAHRRQDIQPDAAGIPGHRPAGERRRARTKRGRAGGARGDRPARAAGARQRPDVQTDHRRGQQGRHRREHHGPDRGQGDRRGLQRITRRAARRDRPRDGRRTPRHRRRSHRVDGTVEGPG